MRCVLFCVGSVPSKAIQRATFNWHWHREEITFNYKIPHFLFVHAVFEMMIQHTTSPRQTTMAANANKDAGEASLLKHAWLVSTNFVIAFMWARVFLLGVRTAGWMGPQTATSRDEMCAEDLGDAVEVALYVSFIELVSSLIGVTRSPIWAVAMFSSVRFGVETLVAPMIECTSWQHLLTVIVWGLGDTIRFGTFTILSAFPGATIVKSIRYTISPLLFPVGAFLEMLMVCLAASENEKPILYGAAALWPVCFYPMMQQLLKQRRKHFASLASQKKKVIKAV